MKRLLIFAAVLFLALQGCTNTGLQGESAVGSETMDQLITTADSETGGKAQEFQPIALTILQEASPEEGWVKLSEQALEDIAGQRAVVLFFRQDGKEKGEIKAFLQQDQKMYGLGMVGNYGIEQVYALQTDMNGDKRNDLKISGAVGASASVTKVLGYDSETHLWSQWLEAGGIIEVDLNEDGTVELVEVSQGSLPPYAYIYRWRNGSYEKLDVARATGNVYADLLYRQSSGYCFTAGKEKELRYCRYDGEKLEELQRSFADIEDFILPGSEKRELTMEDIVHISAGQLPYAVSEIYARHGLVFTDREYADYFRFKPWYRENPEYKETELNEVEKRNSTFLKQYEKKLKSGFMKIAGKTSQTDLNGDGREDRIRLSCEPGDNEFTLEVNGISVKGTGDNLDGCFYIADIDSADTFKEIAVTESGPSDDLAVSFFWFDGRKLHSMGKVQGSEYSIKIDGSGKFITRTRGDILHTWFFADGYRLSEEHQLVRIPQDLYGMNHIVGVKKELSLQKSRTDPKIAVTLRKGEEVMLVASDNKEWCLVENSEGKRGWFAIEGYHTIRGTGEEAGAFFNGLCYAD